MIVCDRERFTGHNLFKVLLPACALKLASSVLCLQTASSTWPPIFLVSSYPPLQGLQDLEETVLWRKTWAFKPIQRSKAWYSGGRIHRNISRGPKAEETMVSLISAHRQLIVKVISKHQTAQCLQGFCTISTQIRLWKGIPLSIWVLNSSLSLMLTGCLWLKTHIINTWVIYYL